MKTLIEMKKNAQGVYEKASTGFRNVCIGAAGLAVAGSSNAAIDVAAVKTNLEAAEASAHSVGTIVIGIVAGLTVVGIVIALSRKL